MKSILLKAHGGELRDLFVTESKSKKQLLEEILHLPRVNLNARQLCDVELLLNGAFSPLDGFLTEQDYDSVVSTMRLSTGILWPIPIVLDVADVGNYAIGQRIVLCDEYGKPIAILSISSIYRADKEQEAQKVYGTKNVDHFGVRYLFNRVGKYYIGGKLEGLTNVERFDFSEHRLSPFELREVFLRKGWEKIIGFQTRNPLHRAHFSMMREAAQQYKAKVLIHPSVGLTKDGDIDYITRVRCYLILHKIYMKKFSYLSLLPLAMRMAGPREALWHAIIRKNYGCTHFIVGRDHAGPGKDRNDNKFYGPYDAQNLAKHYEDELGISIITFDEMVYAVKLNRYVPVSTLRSGEKSLTLSGTELRQRLLKNKPIPDWFTFPEIIPELRRGMMRERRDGVTIFFTGLPSAGKSTLAKRLYFRLLECQNKKVTLLDGDVVRQNLSIGLGFSREDRIENIKRIGFVANEITKHGGIAICSAVAPYEEARQRNRTLIEKTGTYIEVYVSTPREECEQRDVKGLYKKAKLGLLKGITGVDDPYEVPTSSELIIDTTGKDPERCVRRVLTYLARRKLIISERV